MLKHDLTLLQYLPVKHTSFHRPTSIKNNKHKITSCVSWESMQSWVCRRWVLLFNKENNRKFTNFVLKMISHCFLTSHLPPQPITYTCSCLEDFSLRFSPSPTPSCPILLTCKIQVSPPLPQNLNRVTHFIIIFL